MVSRKSKAPNETLQLIAKRSRRDVLLDEAARQLNARGISQTALIDLASALGLSRAAVYYYADDRQDLVFQCYRRACEALARDLSAAARDSGSGLDRIVGFIVRSLDPDRVEEAVLSEVAYLEGEARATIAALAGGVLAQLVDLIEDAQRRGEIRVCDSQIIAHALIGIVSWVPLAPRWVGDDPDIRAQQRRRRDRPRPQRRRRQSEARRPPAPARRRRAAAGTWQPVQPRGSGGHEDRGTAPHRFAPVQPQGDRTPPHWTKSAPRSARPRVLSIII
jgi:AcrR family transcriptional regulator